MSNRTMPRALCALFPALGLAGFALRMLQLRSGPAGMALPALIALLLLLSAAAGRSLPAGTAVFYVPDDAPVERGAFFACAGLCLLWAFSLLVSGGGASAGLCALAAVFLLLLMRRSAPPALLWAGLTALSALRLAVFFVAHAGDPIVADFWVPLLALCAAAASASLLTGAACGLPRPRRTAAALLLGGALCLAALADCCTPGLQPCFWGFLAAAVLQFERAWRLLSPLSARERK